MASSRCSRSSITRRSEREGAKLASGSAHRRREPFVSIQLRRTPFDWIDEGARPRIFWILTALVVGLSLVLGVLGEPLYSEAAPLGIVSLELARNAETAGEILRSWSVEARESALFLQGLDSLYLFAYPAWLGLGCTLVARRQGGALRRLGVAIAWLVLAAGLLDAVENYALAQILFHGASDGWTKLAWASACPKFGLIALAFLYLLPGGAWMALRGRLGTRGLPPDR